MKLEFSRQFLKKKHSNIKFHENPSSESRVVPSGQMDITKLIADFCNFAKAPKSPTLCPHSVLTCFVWIADVELSYCVLVFVTETASVYCAVRN